MTSNHIILTGFMGTGKTTVGRLLAARTGRTFVDTDELIVQRTGKTVAQIFAGDGARAFRALEAQVAQELAAERGLVIATGGRLMLDGDNAAALEANNLVLCLSAEPEEILSRIAGDGVRRPLLETDDPAKRVHELLQERAEGYGRYAQIATSNRPPNAVAQEILQEFELALQEEPKPRPGHVLATYPGGSYDVVVGSNLLQRLPALAQLDSSHFVVVTDSNVGPLYSSFIERAAGVITIPAGEQHKTLQTVERLYSRFLGAGLDRSSTVVALGGGVVGDVAGFAAATYMRGVRLVQCPTSLLAMVDASVGGKTGVDLPQGKNLVGAFKQPAVVIADVETLRTLPPAEFSAGMAEVVKHGLIAGASLLQQLEREQWRWPPPFAGGRLQTLITQAVRVKRDVVQDDPFEGGRRAILNLGHTFAHAIEQVSGYAVRHGEAVAMGLVAATALSADLGHCDAALQERIERILNALHLPTRIPRELAAEALFEAMGNDKKKAQGKLRFVLVRDVGDVFVTDDVPREAVLACLRKLQQSLAKE
ncbi:MAG: 3-dehydroquinate synthase [Chloroflexota bacterium]